MKWIIILFLFACNESGKADDHNKSRSGLHERSISYIGDWSQRRHKIKIIIAKIDKCEYIIATNDNWAVHKGNCKNHKKKDGENERN